MHLLKTCWLRLIGTAWMSTGAEDRSAAACVVLATHVAAMLRAYPDGAPAGRTVVRFSGGRQIETDSAFCLSNGRVVEAALETAFPAL